MRDRDWQIGLFGTFDVENYGDLLFPLIAEAELTERLGSVNLHRFSYNDKAPPDWPYKVTSLADLPHMARVLDGVLIGGGFIIRFDKEVAPAYGPPTSSIHHPTGYWLTPALVALQHNIPLIWNAPGMHCNAIPAWADPLMELAFRNSSYIAVRDHLSRSALARFAGEDRLTIVPDTAFGLSRLLGKEPTADFERLRNTLGLTGNYIVIQATLGLDSFLRFVKKHARRLRHYRFLALPLGPALGECNSILNSYNLPRLVRLPEWPQPLLLAELISHAAAVVGHSYHLAVTALAAGVPVFTSADLVSGKYSALLGFENIFPLANDRALDPDWFLQRLGKTEPSLAVQNATEQLTQHWDRVAAVLRAGATTTQSAVNQFWQSLPTLLEDAAICNQDAVKESEVESVKKQRRIEELTLQLNLARAVVEARDERIPVDHHASPKEDTTPLRFLRNSLKRLVRN